MGRLTYESTTKAEIEDRTLAHLQLVMVTKLRRGESFAFTWHNGPQFGSGRTTVWIHPSAGLVFSFLGSRTPSLNREWIEVLAQAADSAQGLIIISEPEGEHRGHATIVPRAER